MHRGRRSSVTRKRRRPNAGGVVDGNNVLASLGTTVTGTLPTSDRFVFPHGQI